MPRPKSRGKPENVSVSEYPAWFADFAAAEELNEGVMRWLADYPAENVKQLIAAVLEEGGAIFISKTRDGGALGITIMFGEEKKRLYAANPLELDIIVQKVS